MNKMFETATKNKYRFPFKGLITTEDLWDLSLENLDVVFRALNKEKKTTDESSLLRTESKEDKILSEKIEIVQYIFMEKQKEKEDQINARKIRLEKQKLYALLQEKKDEELRGKSVEELKKMIEELG